MRIILTKEEVKVLTKLAKGKIRPSTYCKNDCDHCEMHNLFYMLRICDNCASDSLRRYYQDVLDFSEVTI